MSILKVNDFWRSGEKYIATSRYKSLVLYQNKFYVCTETHESGNTFNENIDKFLLVSGGGGSSLVPQGEWDVAYSTTVGPNELLIPRLVNNYDSTFTNTDNVLSVISINPLTLYPLGSGGVHTFFSSTTNQIQNNFTTTKYVTIPQNLDSRSYDICVLYDDANSDIIPNEVFNVFAGGGSGPTLTTSKSLLLGCLNYDGTRQVAVAYCDGINPIVQIINGLAIPATTEITIGINTTLNELYVMSGPSILSAAILPSNLFDTNTLTLGLGGAAGSFLGSNGFTSIEFPNINYIAESRQSMIVVPPEGATDGSLWEVVSDGVYNNITVKTGDYVIFHNDLNDIILLPNLTTELNTINSQIDYINNQITGNLLELNKQVILNGIIDDCGNSPSSTLTGYVYLAYNNPPPGMLPFRLHVYNNAQWNLVDVPYGAEFSLASTGIKIRHNVVSFTGKKSQFQSYILNTGIINRLRDIINNGSNDRWEIVLDSHYPDNCIMHIGNSGESVDFDINLYDSLHLYLDDFNSDTFNDITLQIIDDTDSVLRKLTTYSICIENRKSYDINVYLNNAYAGQLKPVYPLSSTTIKVPKNSILNLNYRPILNNENSLYKLIEYVSGSYKNVYYFLDSNSSNNINNPSKVIVNYTTGDTFTFTIETLFQTEGMTIDVILKNNFGSPVQFIFTNGGVNISQSALLGIYTLMYDSGSWSIL